MSVSRAGLRKQPFAAFADVLAELADIPDRIDQLEKKIDAKNGEPECLLVTVDQAARMLAVSDRTIYKMIAEGSLVPHKIGTATRLEVARLKEWVANSAQKGERSA